MLSPISQFSNLLIFSPSHPLPFSLPTFSLPTFLPSCPPHRPRRLEQYLEIKPQGPVPPTIAKHNRAGVEVLKIQIHPFFETNII